MPNLKHNKKAVACNHYTLLPDIVLPLKNNLCVQIANDNNIRTHLHDTIYQQNYYYYIYLGNILEGKIGRQKDT